MDDLTREQSDAIKDFCIAAAKAAARAQGKKVKMRRCYERLAEVASAAPGALKQRALASAIVGTKLDKADAA